MWSVGGSGDICSPGLGRTLHKGFWLGRASVNLVVALLSSGGAMPRNLGRLFLGQQLCHFLVSVHVVQVFSLDTAGSQISSVLAQSSYTCCDFLQVSS